MTCPDRFRPVPSRMAVIVSLGLLGIVPVASRADPASAPPSARPRALVLPKVTLPTAPEPDGVTAGGPGPNPLTGRAASPSATSPGQTLTAPVTVNASTSTDALTVTQTGGGRAINGAVTSASNGLSAVKGITAGTGSGVNGVNSGTSGQAGKFEITNASSAQPSLLVTTTGTGSGVQSIVKNTGNADAPAVLGQHNATVNRGIGVEGDGGLYGVYGQALQGAGVYGLSASGQGVYGYSGSKDALSYGVWGESDYSAGVFGSSLSSDGVDGDSLYATGVYGHSQSAIGVLGVSTNGGAGVYGASNGEGANSFGVQGQSAHYAGVYGTSGVAIGVFGQSDTGIGVVGQSRTNWAGVFHGSVLVDNTLFTKGLSYTSDRDQKQDFVAIDPADVLTRIAAMPITAWDYKARPAERHIGPMAQDFRAAFGLGVDEKHIDVVDGIGVSLAAIQELQRQLQAKEARIEALESQALAQREATEARFAALEQAASAAASAVAHP